MQYLRSDHEIVFEAWLRWFVHKHSDHTKTEARIRSSKRRSHVDVWLDGLPSYQKEWFLSQMERYLRRSLADYEMYLVWSERQRKAGWLRSRSRMRQYQGPEAVLPPELTERRYTEMDIPYSGRDEMDQGRIRGSSRY